MSCSGHYRLRRRKSGSRTRGSSRAFSLLHTTTCLHKPLMLLTCLPTQAMHPSMQQQQLLQPSLLTCSSLGCTTLLHSQLEWPAPTISAQPWAGTSESGWRGEHPALRWVLISSLSWAISTGPQTSETRKKKKKKEKVRPLCSSQSPNPLPRGLKKC